MPRPIYALDPDETWEIDYSLEVARFRERIWEQLLVKAKAASEAAAAALAGHGDEETPVRAAAQAKAAAEAEAQAQAAAQLEAARADLTGYEAGSGPIFTVGHIPAAKRPEIQGLGLELSRIAPDAKERPPGEFAWQREIVRWAVRGHRNLRWRRGGDVPFASELVSFDGEQRPLVSRQTLEVYGQSGLLQGLGGLGYLCLEEQRLSGDEKNA